MNTKKLTIWVIMISFLLLPISLLAQPGPEGRGGMKGRCHWRGAKKHERRKCPVLLMYDRITEQLPELLDLKDSQIDKYNEIKKQHRQSLKEICEQLERERESFKKDIESILTPEQQEKLRQLQKKAHRMGKARMGRGKGAKRLPHPRLIVQAIRQMDIPEDKAAEIKEILMDTRNRVQSANRYDKKEMRKIFKDMIEQIKQVLSPEEYERMKEIVRDLQSQQEGRFRNKRFSRQGAGQWDRPFNRNNRHRGRPGNGPGRRYGPGRFGPDDIDRPAVPPEREQENEFLW